MKDKNHPALTKDEYMEEFLKIVSRVHTYNKNEFIRHSEEITKPIKEELQTLLSSDNYIDMEEKYNEMITDIIEYSFVEGMKTAIKIIGKEYVPVI